MPPNFTNEFEYYNNRGKCPYFGRLKPGFKCEHPKRQHNKCDYPINCSATQKQWNELVLDKEVEFKPYTELI